MSSTRNSQSSRAAHKRRDASRATLSATPSSGGVPQNNRPVVQHVVSRVPQAFRPWDQTYPNVLRCAMRWSWYGNLSTAAGAATVQQFRLTSLFDPDFTGTGNQPRFFDTLCAASGGSAPYQYYRVRKVHYRVSFYNNTTTSGASSIGYVQPFHTNGISTTCTLDQYFDGLNLAAVLLSTNGSENSMQYVEGSVDVAKFYGDRDIEDDEEALGVYNGNPAKNVFLTVGVRAMDDTTVTGIRTVVQFVYEVDFLGLNNAGES